MNIRSLVVSIAFVMAAISSHAAVNGEIRALLLHLGHNMWCDYYPEGTDLSKVPEKSLPDRRLRNVDALWREATDYAAAKGVNMLVVDVGEGMVFPSHPELAIEGSWPVEKVKAEIARLNALGLEVIPKLNFSTLHDGWLGPYRRMVSTPEYYKVCEDALRDVHAVFNSPRIIHIGMDEEDEKWALTMARRQHVVARRGEVWKHDFLFYVGVVEKLGSRAWAWSDYSWDHKDFLEWCPKSVLLSNWYYDESMGGFDPADRTNPDYKRLINFWELEKRGFDQLPCGTNWIGWYRRKQNAGAEDVIGKLVATTRNAIGKERLKGFLMAPWRSCDDQEGLAFNKHAIDLFAAALEGNDGKLVNAPGGRRFILQPDKKIVLIAEGCLTNGMVTVRRTVTDSIAAAGYVPLVLPDFGDTEAEDAMLENCAALVIFGALKGSDARRKEFETRLIRRAAERKRPVVGFCHGLQVINTALGGTIHRNPTNAVVKIVHRGKLSPYIQDTFHEADVKPGSLTAEALGAGTQTINTSHNYSIDRLADGFEVTATSPDGVIEAIEHRELPITAFQFHPERLSPKDPRFLKLIRLAIEGWRK